MNASTSSRRAALWTAALGTLALFAPATVAGQDKPPPLVEEEDLGNGFRAVSVNGGPPAIIDDETGLILKQIKGRPAVVDQEAGALLIEGDDGEPVLKFYRDKTGGGGDRKADPKKLARMKAFMKKVKSYGKAMDKVKRTKGRAALGKKEQGPAKTWEAHVARYMKLLQLSPEEAGAIQPMLEAILLKQDEIHRSTVDLAKGQPKAALPKTPNPLPPAIKTFIRNFREAQSGKVRGGIEASLAAFRAARKKQDTELKDLRQKLREVLTVVQEAKLTAVGVLD